MLEASRQETSAEIVANCFCKVCITKEVQADEIHPGQEVPSCLSDLIEAWISLLTNWGAPDDVQICDFLYVDNCTVTTEEMKDEALAETVRDRSYDNEPWEDDSACAMPSAKENPTYVLMTYVSGDAIDLIADKTDKEVVAMCMHVLRDIFRDQASSTTFTKRLSNQVSRWIGKDAEV
ncbi:hypothetical protein HPB51_021447 [Rhipicephalus microplus]|uniref:Amine oxidase domain-containing protein n=1 Tax=Rhipicephalus microplus TaxID=6941 RepID=A0A9J6DXE3_RHIMP|nr:hypothetical protein HPB51_021447 [Rhipicephalus microplus]